MLKADKIKSLLAALLMVLGVVGYYILAKKQVQFASWSWVPVLLGLLLSLAVMSLTQAGKDFLVYGRESWLEAQKVSWPTRKETMQVTLVIIVFVAVLALFLYAVDAAVFWVTSQIYAVRS